MKSLLSVLVAVSGVALAQSPGTFTATAGMGAPRYFHTAVLLQDGRVLIAGGQNDSQPSAPLSTTEIYDPLARIFTPGPNRTVGRSGHAATLLPDGRVLIAGGDWSETSAMRIAARTAEIYDPSAGAFTATGSLLMARNGPNMTLLANGKVLITGGVTGENSRPDWTGWQKYPAKGNARKAAASVRAWVRWRDVSRQPDHRTATPTNLDRPLRSLAPPDGPLLAFFRRRHRTYQRTAA